jgi:autotransporter-associated beta strand protein
MQRIDLLRSLTLVAVFLGICATQSWAQSTWTGGAGTNWNNAGNWTGGIPTTNTVLNFGGTITNQPTNNDIAGLTTGNINFTNNGVAHTTAFTLGTLGQSITLGGSITTTAIAGGGTPITDVINLNLAMSASRAFNIGLSHDLTINGVISGSGFISKTGAGVLTLAGANSYTGITYIDSGTLKLGAANGLPGSTVEIKRGSTSDTNPVLDLNGFSDTIGAINFGHNTSNASNAGGSQSIINSGGAANLTLGGNVTYRAGSTGFQNGQATISANLILGGTNREFIVGDSSNAAIDLLVSGDITASDGLLKTGAGLMRISGNNSWTGTTFVREGTLQLGSSTALSSAASSLNFQLANGGATTGAVLDLNGFNATVSLINLGAGTTAVGNLTSQIIDSAGGGLLTLAGGVTYNTGTAGNHNGQATISANLNLNGATRTFTINDSTNTTQEVVVSGNIQNSTGTAGLTKEQTGVLVLSGTNTYNGTTTVNSGLLRLESANALPGGIGATGGTSALTINGGVIGLGNGNFTRALGTGADQVQLTATNSGFAAYGADRIVNFGGSSAAVTWGSGSFMTAGNNFVLSQATATHTVDLQNPVSLNGTRFFVVNDGAATVDGRLSGAITGSTSFSKAGAGTLELTNTGNAWTGTTFIDSGTLRLGAANVLPGNTVEIKRAAVTDTNPILDLNGFSDTVGGISFGSATQNTTGNSGQTPSIVNSGAAATLTLGNTVTYYAGTAGHENGQATISANLNLNSLSNAREFNIADSPNAAIDLLVSGDISPTGASNSFLKNGAGLMRISGNNSWNGVTFVQQGTLQLGSNTAFSSSATDLNLRSGFTASNTTAAILDLNGFNANVTGFINLGGGNSAVGNVQAQIIDSAGGGLLTLNNGVTYNVGNTGTPSLQNGQATISANVNLNGATRDFLINDSANTTQEVVVSGVIQNSTGTAGLTKGGAGVLVLSGANTYNGTTTVSAGTLILQNNRALQNSALATTGAGTLTLDTGGTTPTIGGLTGATGNLATIISSGYSSVTSLTLNPNSGSVTYGGVIANGAAGMNLIKAGAGTQVFTGTNTYTGTTTVNAGILKLDRGTADNSAIATDGVAGTTDITISGGTLELAQSEQIGNTGRIVLSSGSFNFGSATGKTETIGAFTNNGGSFVTGANTLAGIGSTITFGGGTNTVSNGGLVQDAHVVITGGTNTVQGGATGGVLQVQTGGAGLEMSNGSNLTLNSDNVNAGKLLLQGNVSTSGNSTVTITSGLGLTNKGTVDLDGGNRTVTVADGTAVTDFSVSAVITNGGLTKAGAGTLELSGDNLYDGTTSVNAGTLLINGDQSAANGAIMVASGATLGGTGTSGAVTTTIGSGATLTGGTAGSTGALTFTGDVTAQVGSTWLVDLVGGLGQSTDRINANGLLTLGGNLLIAESGTWTYGQVFQIAQYGTISGTFGGLAEGAMVFGSNGGQYQINYAQGGNSVTLSAVPEPSTVASMVLLLAGALWYGRRRKQAASAAVE